MVETKEFDFVDTATQDISNEKKGETPTHKGQKNLNYLTQKDETEILLLDMLRANEISREDYVDFIRKHQLSYEKFLKEPQKENE